MWVDIIDKYPIINVVFNDCKQSDEEFNKIFDKWEDMYEEKKDFIFIIDTTNINSLNLNYAYKMAKFIKKMKKEYEYHYLNKTMIVMNNNFILNIIKILLSLTSPISEMYLIKSNENNINFIKSIKSFNDFEIIKNHFKDDIKIIS